MSDATIESCILRRVEFKDSERVTELLRNLGLVLPEGQKEIHKHWQRLWIDNPALQIKGASPARGWVLENAERMVGFFGNIPLLYDYGGRPIIVADASQWGVEKNYRSETSRLAKAYFTQKNVALLLVTTGIKPTGRIFLRYGGRPVPQLGCDQVLLWVLNPHGFMRAGLTKKGINEKIAAVVSSTCAPVIRAGIMISNHSPSGIAENIDQIKVHQIEDEFDGLWLRKRDEVDCLMANRTSECLRWHFGTKSMMQRTHLLVCRKQKELVGYAAIMREDAPNIGLKRLKIIDLFVANNNEEVIDRLIAAAFELAQSDGCDVLELIGLPCALRDYIISRHNPCRRKLETWPAFYKVMQDDLKAPLKSENAWYMTGYDGDTALF
tara:strand:+ start:545 stop:1687 length:1143 start_codon:yes stop_codon:yes gene_type:complete